MGGQYYALLELSEVGTICNSARELSVSRRNAGFIRLPELYGSGVIFKFTNKIFIIFCLISCLINVLSFRGKNIFDFVNLKVIAAFDNYIRLRVVCGRFHKL